MIEECAAFPFGAHDDLCDTMTQALMRFREGGLVSLNDDYEDHEKAPVKRIYYWWLFLLHNTKKTVK